MRRAKPKARERILTDSELRKIWKAASATNDSFGSMVKVLLLTGARKSEIAGMRWSEIDDKTGDWKLPSERHKLKTDLTRPLSKAARDQLDRLPRIDGSDFLFSADGTGALGHISGRKAKLEAASGTSGWTIHDLRRTSRSLMSRAGVPPDHAERIVGHVIGGMRGVYDQHKYRDEMLLGLEKLAALIAHIVDPKPNVVPLKAQG
jgi:integrase